MTRTQGAHMCIHTHNLPHDTGTTPVADPCVYACAGYAQKVAGKISQFFFPLISQGFAGIFSVILRRGWLTFGESVATVGAVVADWGDGICPWRFAVIRGTDVRRVAGSPSPTRGLCSDGVPHGDALRHGVSACSTRSTGASVSWDCLCLPRANTLVACVR